jgi:hypothetical protein
MEPVSDLEMGYKVWRYFGVVRDFWRRLRQAPQQIADLQRRITELETRLQRCPGEGCPHCGELAFRLDRTVPNQAFGNLGVQDHVWKCTECGFELKKMEPKRS